MDGLQGVDKTNSAESMGHSKFGIGFITDLSMDPSVLQDQGGYEVKQILISGKDTSVDEASESNFLGATIHTFMSIGIGDYFDFAVGLPIYYEAFTSTPLGGVCAGTTYSLNCTAPSNPTVNNTSGIDGLKKSAFGDVQIKMKLRAPIPEDESIVDLAFLLGGTVPTSKIGGIWVRQVEYVGKKNTTGPDTTTGFGISQSEWNVAALGTVDFRRLDDPLPLVFHANFGYRSPVSDYSPVFYYSGAAEVYLATFVSLFGEVYNEKAADAPASNLDALTVTAGGAIHTSIGIEFYVALHAFLGDQSKFDSLVSVRDGSTYITYNGRTEPKMSAQIGFTWNGFLIEPDQDHDGIPDKDDWCPTIPQGPSGKNGCPDPDPDHDGVCSPWVNENNLLDKFTDVCKGVDLCPDLTQGPDGKFGCPDPDPDKDGVCSPWVSERGLLGKFKDICAGVDKCPNTPQGPGGKDGCPMADADGDGIPDAQDLCPNIPQGPGGKFGCPDPDADKDGFCDQWVYDLGLQDKFKDVCAHDTADKCPTTAGGPGSVDGCPVADADGDGVPDAIDLCPHIPQGINGHFGCPDPDPDKDGFCDQWVYDLKLQDKFKDVCIHDTADKCSAVPGGVGSKDGCPLKDSDGDGIPDDSDLCPTVPQGINGMFGCPDPDPDRDSICDPWVSEKGLSAKFASVCHGSDKCPTVPGPGTIDGCPLKDTDHDGVPDDSDLCPTVPQGINGKFGCPDPDPDKDGFCDQWVFDMKLKSKFADVCIHDTADKCPTVPGGPNSKDGCVGIKPIGDNVILDGVNFKTGTSELTFESKKVLDKIVEQLKFYPDVSIEIRGHTDNVGKRAKNMTLSTSRAKAVVDYFASQGVAAKRMTYAGFADTQPLEDNKTAAGRAKNRRIEMYRTK